MHAIYDAKQGAARLVCNIVAFSKFRQLMGYAFQAVRGITGKTARRIYNVSAIADVKPSTTIIKTNGFHAMSVLIAVPHRSVGSVLVMVL